jgi:hypothetical protein
MRAGQRDLILAANQREQNAFGALLGSAVASGPLAGYAATPQ